MLTMNEDKMNTIDQIKKVQEMFKINDKKIKHQEKQLYKLKEKS